jgi:hypothetical protein
VQKEDTKHERKGKKEMKETNMTARKKTERHNRH